MAGDTGRQDKNDSGFLPIAAREHLVAVIKQARSNWDRAGRRGPIDDVIAKEVQELLSRRAGPTS